jgi:tripartite-type tricarboxylate transporter receptor subunit TctC
MRDLAATRAVHKGIRTWCRVKLEAARRRTTASSVEDRIVNAKRLLLFALGCVALTTGPSRALAQSTYPQHVVRLVVPYAAAGGADLVARAYAEGLSKRLGQQVIVENRPGANGNIGAEFVARAKPDGYTLLFTASTNLVVNPALYKAMPYNPQTDLSPVAIVALAPLILVADPSLSIHSVKDLADYARAHPGKLTFASAGVGSSGHLAGELFKAVTGVQMLHVPFNGTAPATTSLLAGQVSVMFNNLPPSLALTRSGKLRALAVTGTARSAAAPEYPTMAEAGFPDVDVTIWNAVLAPAGTDRHIIDKLNSELATLSKDPKLKEQLAAQGIVATSSTPEQLASRVRDETVKWEKIVRGAEIPKE